ncbi:hypothetical protein ACS0X5_35340 [Burkholderia gladioli]|uniref:hypothetical protein n=1 Tax=Burkholderia gladioli TaxID=28095 RepID=UPI0003A2453A|nr:hypothetical protein [Burkholderia gladioli]NHH83929.1 hypothetical protein [Burkholderia gladioli]CAG9192428.1 conserved hypothetical protein [Burkholderia gladioli]
MIDADSQPLAGQARVTNEAKDTSQKNQPNPTSRTGRLAAVTGAGQAAARRLDAGAREPRGWRIRYTGKVELETGRITRSEHLIEFDRDA